MKQDDRSLEDDYSATNMGDFEGATLQIDANDRSKELLLNGNIEAGREPAVNKNARPNSLSLVPWSGENADDFFSNRSDLVVGAINECRNETLTPDDGDFIGAWLLTEISFWDNEKERLVLLTTRCLHIVKYDFIALKPLDSRRIPLDVVDTVVVGDLTYPPVSLMPHIDGLATGVSSVIKGCLIRPLQERWAGMPPCTAASNTFVINSFEPRSRNLSGVRIMWNQGRPLPFTKKWNPFEQDIPFATFTSHPLLWHKDDDTGERKMYNVDDLTASITSTLDRRIKTFQCHIQHKTILLENYIGLGALIHNKNSLGFFKVRGKFSF